MNRFRRNRSGFAFHSDGVVRDSGASPERPRPAGGAGICFEEFELGNGLRLIVHPDRHLPIVAVNLWYHVGSKNETEGKTGFAHLFEHMMFQGSENVPPNGHFSMVQKAGGTLNGSTTFDRTNYYETLPSHQLELGLWLEADRMRSLRLDENTLETQRNVVMEERRSRYDNQPYGTIYEELFARAWKIQPYRRPTIGSMADIRNAALEDVSAFHAMFYRPDNACLCIAGDVEVGEALRLTELHFGDIPRGKDAIGRPSAKEAPQSLQVRDFIYDKIPLPALAAGFHIPSLDEEDFTAVELIAAVLSSGDSSRLHQRIVYRERAAQAVSAYALGLELPGILVFRATAQPQRSSEEAERMLFEELEAFCDKGVTDMELGKARNMLEASFVRELSGIQSRADMLNAYRTLSGDASLVNSEIDRIRAVTPSDILRVARERLTPRNSTVLHALPRPERSVS